jgi:hypothetical protein
MSNKSYDYWKSTLVNINLIDKKETFQIEDVKDMSNKSYDYWKSTLTNIIENKENFGNVQRNIEHFDVSLVDSRALDEVAKRLSLTGAVLQNVIQNIDTNFNEMTIDMLNDRALVLNKIKIELVSSFREPIVSEYMSYDQVVNAKALYALVLRSIDLIINHTNTMKEKLTSGVTNVEFFTVTPIVNKIPLEAKEIIGEILARFDMKFTDVVDFMNLFEVSASKLTPKQKQTRLRILQMSKYILYMAKPYDYIMMKSSPMGYGDWTQRPGEVQYINVGYFLSNYILDLYLRETYMSMTPAEIKLGMPFEKHLEFYKLSDNDSKAYQLEFKALNAQMLKNNNDMTELVKIKKELELKLVTVKEELESNLANIKKEKEFQINALNDQNLKTIDELKTQNFKTTDELKNQNSKITSELRALEQIKNKIETDCKQVQDLINKKQDENVKLQLEIKNLGTVKNDLLSQVGLLSSVKSSADNLIIGLVIVTILCILMTVMYFRK